MEGRNYTNWGLVEDAKLVEEMVNMVNTGAFRADNGFKSGYMLHLEKKLQQAIPNCTLKAKPNIESRLKVLKRDWQVVYDMVYGTNTSGFGYDNSKKCVVAEDDVWDAYIKVHKGAAKWKNKSFPHFEELCTVYGKDRAQGGLARDCVEMEHNANIEEEANEEEAHEEEPMGDSHDVMNSIDEPMSTKSKKRKRGSASGHKLDPVVEGIKEAAFILGNQLKEASEQMNESLRADKDLQTKISKVRQEIKKCTFLSRSDQYKVSRKMMREPEMVLTFWAMEGEDRDDFVREMLEEIENE